MRMVQRRKIWMPRTPIDGNGASYGGNFQFACLRAYQDVVLHWLFGNVAADATVAIQQAKNIGGSGAKTLAFDTIWLVSAAAGDPVDMDKAVRHTVAANAFTVANATMDNHHMMVELHASQLDVQNGFDCIRPTFVGGAGATLVAMLVEFLNPRYSGDEGNLNVFPSALDQT